MHEHQRAHAGIRNHSVSVCAWYAAYGRARVVSGTAGLTLDNKRVGLPAGGTGFCPIEVL